MRGRGTTRSPAGTPSDAPCRPPSIRCRGAGWRRATIVARKGRVDEVVGARRKDPRPSESPDGGGRLRTGNDGRVQGLPPGTAREPRSIPGGVRSGPVGRRRGGGPPKASGRRTREDRVASGRPPRRGGRTSRGGV